MDDKTIKEDLRWRDENLPRVILGTAQLGMEYGIANRRGRLSENEAAEIVGAAWEHGIHYFDTAQAYGESEATLGRALMKFGVSNQAKIMTKLSPDLDPKSSPALLNSIEHSTRKLGVKAVWGALLHRPDWLQLWDGSVGDALRNARDAGIVDHVGVSVYSVSEAREALQNPEIELIQVPCSAWDQRMLAAGIFERARQLNKLCLVRSVYLQGLLTLPPAEVGRCLPRAQPASQRWFDLSNEFGISPIELAVRFVLSLRLPIVIGMETVEQIRATVELMSKSELSEDAMKQIRTEMAPFINDNLLDPGRW